MVTYSYIPPEYKIPTKMASTSPEALLSQHPTCTGTKNPHIPYRDTGAAGKYIFGRPPSWTFKPLPLFPFEKVEKLSSKPPPSKLHEEDCDSMTTETGEDELQTETEAKKEGKIAKVVKNFSERFGTAVSKTQIPKTLP